MKKVFYLLFLTSVVILVSCKKEEGPSERFNLLTTPTWESVDLLVDGEDASGEGQLLENFKGDVKFYKDGTGYFGQYTGTWGFASKETELVIYSQEIGFPLTTLIQELSTTTLRITTTFPSADGNLSIEMSFNAK